MKKQTKSPRTNDIAYFDYNATHPPIIPLINAAHTEYQNSYFNPSGATRYSLTNQGKIETVRKYFSKLTGFPERSIVFSSTGTEANYLLIRSLAVTLPQLKSVIISPFEHSSMYSALEDHGLKLRILPTDDSGIINLDSLEAFLAESRDPVICLMAGNETGVIQPIEKISQLTEAAQVTFLSDLMQAFGKIPINYRLFSGVTFSSHKIGGGMGSAITIVPDPETNYHLFAGGNQENSRRAGTENLPAILSFQSVSEYQIEHLQEKNNRLYGFRTQLENALEEMGCQIIAKNSLRAPNASFVLLPIEEIDFFLLGLEEKNIIVSTGSSCKSRAREASASLLAMGFAKEEALRCIRISTGLYSTQTEIDHLISSIRELLAQFKN